MPFGERGSAALFENVTAVYVTVLVEMIVDRGVSGNKLRQDLDVLEPGRLSFSSSNCPDNAR